MTWAIITGEYPPQPGGVSDYTWTIANGLSKFGDKVHVIAPGRVDHELESNVNIYRLRGRFGIKALIQMHSYVAALPNPHRVIVEYVTQSFGFRGVNLPFVVSLCLLRRYPLWIMIHEYAIQDDSRASLPQRLLALGTRVMAKIALSSAQRVFISTSAWRPLVEKASPRQSVIELPIPSSVPTKRNTYAAAELAERFRNGRQSIIGHFGTYRMEGTIRFLKRAIEQICVSNTGSAVLLMGRGSEKFCQDLIDESPPLAGRLHGTGVLDPESIANHLSACDVLLQPYEDGVTSRRSSLVAGLGLGIPIVTTSGPLTEDFWVTSEAVALSAYDVNEAVALAKSILSNPDRRRALSDSAKRLYDERFDVSLILSKLREE